VLQPLGALALEVTRALQFFYTSTQYNQVNHIFCPRLRDIDVWIKSFPSAPK
jgi:Tfp pilus assembly PilM family ATPase